MQLFIVRYTGFNWSIDRIFLLTAILTILTDTSLTALTYPKREIILILVDNPDKK